MGNRTYSISSKVAIAIAIDRQRSQNGAVGRFHLIADFMYPYVCNIMELTFRSPPMAECFGKQSSLVIIWKPGLSVHKVYKHAFSIHVVGALPRAFEMIQADLFYKHVYKMAVLCNWIGWSGSVGGVCSV